MAYRQNVSDGSFVYDNDTQQTNDKPIVRLKVQAPYKTYYNDDIYSISAQNDTGPFDILPRHQNFITILRAGELKIESVKAGQQKIIISGGVMHVKADEITVFLDV